MKIIYGTDGSAGAAVGAGILSRLLLTPEDTVLLLAVDPLAASSDQSRFFEEPLRALEGCPARLETHVRSGAPAEEIIDAAREENADLIVTGAMGATGLARFFMGSVSERVLRHAVTPVLVARPVRHGLKRALVAVDRSEVGQRVVEAARGLPVGPETEFRLVTVVPPQEAVASMAPMVWTALSRDMEAILKGALEEAEERLRAFARQLQAPDRKVSAEVLRGEPASALIAAVEQEGVDLVILGSHGEGGVDRFLLGSVSERVARHGRCSVLVVR